MAIIVDAAYEGISDDPDVKFFDGDKPSAEIQQAMDYCSNYERDRLMTVQFAETMKKYELISSQVAQFTPEGGEPSPFAQYNGVDEAKLTDLADDKLLELRKSNILPILYAQLMSMGNWRMLMDRRARRFNLDAEQVLKPATKQ